MERNRRAGGASGSGLVYSARLQRARNPSDEEDQTEEFRELELGKRPKKDMYDVSAPAKLMNKRKRGGMAQDTQPIGSLEEMKAEDDDELSARPQLQKLATSRVQSKKDNFFLDFSAVPRKQRSSMSTSSRLGSTAKEQDLHFNQQQEMVNGSSLNRERKLKPYGTKLDTQKVSQVSDFSAVSDQEAEVAEALFVLASSTPSPAGVLDTKLEAKLGTEAKCASLSATQQCFVIVPSSSGLDFASAGSKGRQPQIDAEKKVDKSPVVGVIYSASSPSEIVHSSVGETELEFVLPRQHSLAGEATSLRSETSNSKIPASSPHCVPCWPRQNKETSPRAPEEQCRDCNGAKKSKQETQINAEMEEGRPEVVNKTPAAMQRKNVHSLGNHDEALTKSSRSDGFHNRESKIDLKVLEYENGREHSSPLLVKEDYGKVLSAGNGYLKSTSRADGGTHGSIQETEDQKKKTTSETIRRPRDRDLKAEDLSSKPSPNRKVNDTGTSSVSSCFSSLSSTAVSKHAPICLAGGMSGFPYLGYDGSAATSWAATSSLSIDMKAAQPAMQLPHVAISSPVPKMKSCATHVYVAHFIHRERLATRHSLWSAALCSATAYNLNIPPVKPLDIEGPREAITDPTQKDQAHQTESSFVNNISQSSTRRLTSSGSVHGSSGAGSQSASNYPSCQASSETSTVPASGHSMADHAQYLQTIMRQSGVASFPHLVNG